MYKIEYALGVLWLNPARLPLMAKRLVREGEEGNDTVVIPERAMNKYGCEVSVIRVARSTFAGNEEIKKVVLGKNIFEVAAGAFAGCSALEEIHIPKAIKRIEAGTFEGCSRLKDVYYEGSYYDWKQMKIVTNRHEVKLNGKCTPGSPVEGKLSDVLVHIPGNDALFTADIHFMDGIQN